MSSFAIMEEVPPSATPPTDNPLENVIVLAIAFRRLGLERTISSNDENIEVQADRRLLRFTKKILDGPEFRRIEAHDRMIRAFVAKWTIPCDFLKSSMHLLRLDKIDFVDSKLQEYFAERKTLVEQACQALPARIAEIAPRLNALHDIGDYPTPEQVAKAYSVDLKYINLSVPGKIQKFSAAIYRREAERVRTELNNFKEMQQAVFIENLQQTIEQLQERLSPADGSRKKVFRKDAIPKLEEYLDRLIAQTTPDENLESLAKHLKRIISDVDPRLVNRQQDARTALKAQLDTLTESISTQIVDAPRRNIVIPGGRADV